jgi:Chitin synthase
MVQPMTCSSNFRGDTRRIEGELKGGGHGGDDGEFDSSPIVMKRWAEFERDRRRTQLASHSFDLPQPIPISGGRPTSRPPSSKEPSSVRGYDAGYI